MLARGHVILSYDPTKVACILACLLNISVCRLRQSGLEFRAPLELDH